MIILLGLRKEHLNSILKSYHKELEDNLLGLGFELDTYPYAQLLEDYQVILMFKILLNTHKIMWILTSLLSNTNQYFWFIEGVIISIVMILMHPRYSLSIVLSLTQYAGRNLYMYIMVTVGLHPRRIALMKLKTFLWCLF